METRVIKANSMSDALTRTKQVLGPEALIVSAREIDGGSGGVEVTAVSSGSVDPKAPSEAQHESKNTAKAVPSAELLREHIGPLHEEFASLRRMVRELKQLTDEAILPGFNELKTLFSEYSNEQEASRVLGPLYCELVDRGVMPELARDLTRTCEMELGLQNLGRRDWLALAKGLLREVIGRELGIAGPIVPGAGTRAFALCGPSGVGKTTTMAKLASRMTLTEGLEVVMVVTDTYCVGSIDQARRYAELIGVPLAVADRPETLTTTLRSYAGADVLLIDTPGRAFESDEVMRSLKNILLAVNEPIDCCLLIASGYAAAHQSAIGARFSTLHPSRAVVTKVDETAQAGSLLNIQRLTSLPIAYMTTGQRVPEDIETADAERIVERVLGVEN